jgi:hypothetical protein
MWSVPAAGGQGGDDVVEAGASSCLCLWQELWHCVNELGMSQVGAVGEERPSLGLCGREPKPLEELGGEIDPPARDAIEDRSHRRTIGGCQQRELDPVARRELRDAFEQEAKLFARVSEVVLISAITSEVVVCSHEASAASIRASWLGKCQ